MTTARRHALPIFQNDFSKSAAAALEDSAMQRAVDEAVSKKDSGRRARLAELPDANGLREAASQIKRHTLEHLDFYLEQLEANVIKHGGHVHFAATAADANAIVVEIARQTQSKLVVKGKSMVSEEMLLNDALTAAGVEVLETDLGEFVVQVAGDHPSHIVMPIIHKSAGDVGEIFAKFFNVPPTDDPAALAEMARVYLRRRFDQADMGITGVNFAIAETGSICLCTNEGNGRMCSSRPRVHVALMGMEKVIPTLADLPVFIKLLARSASDQSLTQYTSIITGPRRAGERDGPEEFHLVILDNGRSDILAGEFRETLKCIRCGACLNACPVYRKIGGHAYGSVYPGPIGALLTPLFNGLSQHPKLPQATSLCGACFEACPVKIDIPKLLVRMQAEQHQQRITPWRTRMFFKLWAAAIRRPWAYRFAQRIQRWYLRRRSRDGWISKLPGQAAGWTKSRDFPAPAKESFRDRWKRKGGSQ